MADKERVSASVDPEVAEYLSQDQINASGLINDLVKRHMKGGASDEMMREFRIQRLEDEYKDAAATARRKLQEINRMKELTTEAEKEVTREIDDLIDDMKAFDATISRNAERTERIAAEYYGGSIDQTMKEIKERANSRDDVSEAIIND
jgi:hypothetical protein